MAIRKPFPLLGECPALDLVNTRIHRTSEPVELLKSPRAFNAWMQAQGDSLAWHGHATGADLVAMLRLREALHTLLVARLSGTRAPRAAVTALNRALALPQPQARLAWGRTGARKTAARSNASARYAGLLRTLAEDGLDLLTGPRGKLLRECAHPDCTLLFLAHDTRRHWCSSTTCGNRARVARHYREHHRTS